MGFSVLVFNVTCKGLGSDLSGNQKEPRRTNEALIACLECSQWKQYFNLLTT